MDFAKQFLKIRDFLGQHEWLHEKEVLNRYRESIPHQYKSWANQLKDFSQDDKIQLENELVSSKLSPDFNQFLQTITELTQVPTFNVKSNPLKGELARKLNKKKKHEIEILTEVLKHNQFKTLVDFGSGAGHLSTCLIHDNEKESYCLDGNSDFQQIGKKKLKRYFPKVQPRVHFIHQLINEHTDYNFIPDKNDTLFLGLHSCGPLSTYQLQHFNHEKVGGILNFGCCYHKLNDEYNISKLAQESPKTFTNHALTMAAKSFKWLDENSISDREKVKSYRYTLELLLIDHDIPVPKSFGNGSSEDYQRDFPSYAQSMFSRVDIISPISDLEQYFQSKSENVQFIQNLGIIRGMLGRLIEIYLVLDRTLYLEERDFQPELHQYFDRKLSPRNLGISVNC